MLPIPEQHWELGLSFADDGFFGGGGFEADELVGGVEAEKDFEVGGGGFESFAGFSASGGRATRFKTDGAGSQFRILVARRILAANEVSFQSPLPLAGEGNGNLARKRTKRSATT